jgi:hypothetical protein
LIDIDFRHGNNLAGQGVALMPPHARGIGISINDTSAVTERQENINRKTKIVSFQDIKVLPNP